MTNEPSFAAGLSMLLTDGTVMSQDTGTANWWKLTPDNTGSYVNGTWSQLASMPGGYAPLYFGSAVLPDGRVIVEGGEYLDDNATWTTKGAIYDPKTNHWTAVAPPTGWQSIGDASGIVLPNGTYMQSDCCTSNLALLNPTTLKWTSTGSGKQDENDEESWTLLPDGTILTVDANNTAGLTNSEIFDPTTGMWTNAGSTIVQLPDLTAQGGGSHEIGPGVLRGDGTVLETGGTGHNAIYDTTTKTWSQAPDFPTGSAGQLDVADGAGILLPDDNVLMITSPGVFNSPSQFFEWDGTAFTEVTATPDAASTSSFQFTFLMLPTGEAMLTDQSPDVEMYTPAMGAVMDYAPVIRSIPTPVTAGDPNPLRPEPGELALDGDTTHAVYDVEPLATLHPGQTYKVWIDRPNGISQGAYYGDDAQSSTNYPLVRLTNQTSNHVAFARTHDGSTYGIGMDLVGSTRFDVPLTAERGLTSISVVTNGIAGPAITVDLK